MEEEKVEKAKADLRRLKFEEELKEEVRRKELVVRKERADLAIERIKKQKQAMGTYSDPSFLSESEDEKQALQQEYLEYVKALKNRKVFIDDMVEFNENIAFCAKQLILCAAETGSGKSTTVANICAGMIKRKLKPLVISNEEQATDVMARTWAVLKDMEYQRPERFTEEEIEEFNRGIGILYNYLRVIDNGYKGLEDPTTSVEGLESILKAVSEGQYNADAILIDYYQGLDRSLRNPTMDAWKVLKEVTELLEKYRKILSVPIVVFCQLKSDKSDSMTFKERIEGGKSILNRATIAVEITANNLDYLTKWTVHKNRFNNRARGQVFFTGWWKGKYVPYTDAHAERVRKLKAEFAEKKAKEIEQQKEKENAKLSGKTGTESALS